MQEHAPTIQRILLFSLFFFLMYLSFDILKYFVIPVVWASIIVYMTWPIYQYIHKKLGDRKNTSAFLMTFLVVLVVVIPFTMAIIMMQREGHNMFTQLQAQLYSGNLSLPTVLQKFPVVGAEIQRLLNEFNQNPQILTQNISLWIQSHVGYGRIVFAEVSRNIAKFVFAVMTMFFFYRDGYQLIHQVHQALEKVIGDRVNHYMKTISDTTRAVVYGIGLTALAQSLFAGLSYFIAGAPSPMLLTLITFIFALIPFGPPFAYGGVALWLYSQGHTLAAVGVAVWGTIVVSSVDNIIRPLVISGATKIPFIFIMFGVLGGVASFGLIGLFIGPVILSILLAIWREWLQEK